MPVIKLQTIINAPIERCFDLARSIDLHSFSTSKTNEVAVSGVTSGLINLNETVTWEATHFWIRQRLTSRISKMDFPYCFVDEQVKGAFKFIYHQHIFEQKGEQTFMTDIFEFKSPFGILGKLFNALVLTRYMTRFLKARNEILKQCAESEEWRKFIN